MDIRDVKVFEILSCVRHTFQYKYTRGGIISRVYVPMYLGVELKIKKSETIVCHSIVCYFCNCALYVNV